MKFNQLHPPFDNLTVRRVMLGVIDQAAAMQAVAGDDPKEWVDRIGLFGPGMPLANDAEIEVMTRPARSRQGEADLAAAGYRGEPIGFWTRPISANCTRCAWWAPMLCVRPVSTSKSSRWISAASCAAGSIAKHRPRAWPERYPAPARRSGGRTRSRCHRSFCTVGATGRSHRVRRCGWRSSSMHPGFRTRCTCWRAAATRSRSGRRGGTHGWWRGFGSTSRRNQGSAGC